MVLRPKGTSHNNELCTGAKHDRFRLTGDPRDASRIRLLHTFCENERTRYVYVTQRDLLVTFVSNSLHQGAGFRFTVRVVPRSRELRFRCFHIERLGW